MSLASERGIVRRPRRVVGWTLGFGRLGSTESQVRGADFGEYDEALDSI